METLFLKTTRNSCMILLITLLSFSCTGNEKNQSETGSELPYAEKGENASDLELMDKQRFVDDARKSLEEANMRLEEFESDLGSYDELLRREMQSKIVDMKAERDTLRMIIEDIENKNDADWEKLHAIARDDLEELERSIRSFYNDYFNTE